MTTDRLEEKLREYMHLNRSISQFSEDYYIHRAGEAVVVLGSERIVYFWLTTATGQLAKVIVPGILVKERYRTDNNGNKWSLVKPVPNEAKPSLERTVWFDMVKGFGNVHEGMKFDYWPYSGVAQQPQQRE